MIVRFADNDIMNTFRTIRITLSLMLLMVAGSFFPPLHSQSFGDIDTKFVFNVMHFSENNNLGLAADVSTTETYPCAGFRITLSQSRVQDTITVSIGGLVRPNPCFQTQSEATGKLFIGPLQQGQYVLRVYYRGQSDLYKLTLGATQFTLQPIQNEFTELERISDHE